jgi:hypothetical protein
MKKKLITQSDDLIAQGVAKKLIRIGDDGSGSNIFGMGLRVIGRERIFGTECFIMGKI